MKTNVIDYYISNVIDRILDGVDAARGLGIRGCVDPKTVDFEIVLEDGSVVKFTVAINERVTD